MLPFPGRGVLSYSSETGEPLFSKNRVVETTGIAAITLVWAILTFATVHAVAFAFAPTAAAWIAGAAAALYAYAFGVILIKPLWTKSSDI